MYIYTCITEEGRNNIVFVQLASMQQPWRSIRMVVLRFVHKWIFKGFLSTLCATLLIRIHQEEEGGDINYQVIERRDEQWIHTHERVKGKRDKGWLWHGGWSSDTRPAVVRYWIYDIGFAAICQGDSAKFRSTRKTVAEYNVAVW